MYFEGRGKVYIATAANGVPGPFRYVADVEDLQVKLSTTTEEKQENYSGQNLTAVRIVKGKKADLQLTLREWTSENLALALYGQSAAIAAGTVTSEALPPDLAQGDFVRLAYPQVADVVVNDAAATPQALVENTDYSVNPAYGTVEFTGDLSAYTQPLTADYSYTGGTNVAMFSESPPERWIRFEGLNIAASNAPVLVELFRAQLDPVAQADLISDQLGNLQLAGSALYDAVNVNNTALGPFGRVIHINPAA